MEKRQPFKLYRILQIYNVLQILFNAVLFYKVSYIIILINYLISNLFYKDMKTKHFLLFIEHESLKIIFY